MKRDFARIAFAISIALMLMSSTMGQTTFGTITGTVTDPSGAVVPNAKVVITNEGEGVVRQAATGGTGVYSVPNLGVGSYRLQISASGFAPYERTGMILIANQVLNADATLALGQSGTSVQVVDSGAQISTDTSNLSNLKTSRDLEELPLIARHTADLGIYGYARLVPGANNVAGNSIVNVQGLRQATGVLPSIDGIGVAAYLTRSPGPVQPSLEGIQEVNIQLANTPAEFATPSSFSVVTKSGTNAYHGSAFWDYDGNALNTRDFFATSAPFRVYHDFGGSLGGPIRKNKTFFFVDYEGSRDSSVVPLTGNTALPAWRNGDFSGISTVVKDPLTGLAFPGNMIPSSRISPVSQKLQNFFFPLPNYGPPGLQVGNYRGSFPGTTQFTNFDDFGVRIDQNFGNGDKVFARANYKEMPTRGRYLSLPVELLDQIRASRIGVVSWTHLFSPSLLNEARAGFTRHRNYYYPDLVGSDILQQVGMQGVNIVGVHDVPAVYVTGLTTTDQPVSNALSIDTSFQYTDNVSWVRGRHSMKFGFDALRDQEGGFTIPNSIYGQYNFTGPITNNAYADFLLGIPQTTSLSIPTPSQHLRGTTWSAYAQDQFKVNRKLTLNYGVRWEFAGPYYDRYGNVANFNPATGAWAVPSAGLSYINPYYPKNIPITTAAQAGVPNQAPVKAQYHNFYPRIGVAYKPFGNDRTVVRAGYGIFANMIYASLDQSLAGGPFSGSTTFTNALTNGVPRFSFPNPFLSSGTTATQNAFGVNPGLVTPYTQQFNFTVERQIGSAAVRLSYVGTSSVNLVYARNLNQLSPSAIPFSSTREPYPIFNAITYYDNGGHQSYNGLQAALAKNYGKSLTFSSGWTWAKDITDTQDGSSAFTGPTIQNEFNRQAERGNNLITPTHRVFGYVVYQLPFGHGQRFLDKQGSLVQGMFGGWQIALDGIAQSGQFLTPSFSGFDPSNTNTIGGRPDVVPGVSTKPVGTQSINNWFNPAAFKVPGCPDTNPVCTNPVSPGRFGNAGVGIMRGPAIRNLDASLSKYFPIREKVRLQFRMNMANAFNHPNFAQPAANISAPASVAHITATMLPMGSGTAREIDFMLRLEF